MKKKYFAGLALLCAASMGTPAVAQEYSPTATSEVYDFTGFGDAKLLDLFYAAQQEGRNYPTLDEFEAAGIQASDIAFVRSHVRKGKLLDFEDRLNQGISYANRSLWMNIPMGVGQDGKGGYPNSNFSSDVYSMWNYTQLFGSWNHGVFQAPGCWVDAAHKNGTDIFSGIKFFESWTAGSGDGEYSALITKKEADGSFKYVKAFINCLMYFGADGVNYNWEDNSYSEEDITAFHKALYKEAAAQGYDNFHAGIYTANSMLSPATSNALFGNEEGRTFHLMLNYAGGDFTGSGAMAQSVAAAKAAMGTTEGLYTGVWIVNMNRSWTNLTANPEINVCLWGEHGQSRFLSYNKGDDAFGFQTNYQKLLERAFSGGHRNPANRPEVQNNVNNWETDSQGNEPLYAFAGLAEWIPERSTIQGNLPFGTHFILGNGDRYYYKGKKTGGTWYNMGAQDYVPTYRWLVYDANTTTVSNKIQPNFYHKDAYMAGSCLELAGEATATGTDIILYKTKLNVNGNAWAKVAVKNVKGAQPTHLYVIVKTQGSDEWKEYAVGETKGNTWEEVRFDLPTLADGDVIERIGLRVKGEEAAYNLLVGKLEILDATVATPANPKDLTIEVKEETQESMSIKAFWGVDAEAKTRAAWDLLYNDEANIHHFEILYKNGEDGRVSEISRTTSWSTYVAGITFEKATDEPYVGVRSVATDLQTYSPIVWVKVPRAPQNELPEVVEEDTYGISAMDPACEGAAIAREQRYVTSITTEGATQNLKYTASGPVADGSQYADCRDMVLKVKQGQEIKMNIKCADFSDGLKYCFAGGWIDFNASGNFDYPMGATLLNPEQFPNDEVHPMGEMIFKVGHSRAATPEFQTTGIDATFTIPEDATPGASRLRIVFSDAWFAGMFLPTGLHAKGFSMDFSVEIEGTNPGRAAVDTRDQGIADEPEQLEGGNATAIETVANGEVSKAIIANGQLNLQNVEKAWVYNAEGKLVRFMNKENATNISGYAPGAYIVKMKNKNVIRTQKIILK